LEDSLVNIFEDEIVRKISMEEFQTVFTPEIQKVINIIQGYGFDIRVVGGAVRDFLLGKEPRDIDFATDATPAELIFIFDLEGVEYDAGGIEHGTVKAVFGDLKVDVTSLGYSMEVDQGRVRTVRVDGWAQDAERRDLTINSLSLDMNGNIHDPVDGINDLKKSVIRFNKSQYDKLPTHPELILRWFKAFDIFDNPRWLTKDYELIRRYLKLLSKIRQDKKTKKTVDAANSSSLGNAARMMCHLGADRYIDIDCI
jgi:tRNA nucleotidyltransferase (CCA-adding enzyme)